VACALPHKVKDIHILPTPTLEKGLYLYDQRCDVLGSQTEPHLQARAIAVALLLPIFDLKKLMSKFEREEESFLSR
jgi:hypothetical protein